MLNNFHKVIALVVLCCAGLLYGGAEAAPRLDCENNADDGLLCYDKLEGKYVFVHRGEKGRGEIGGVYLPSQLERTPQLCR